MITALLMKVRLENGYYLIEINNFLDQGHYIILTQIEQ